MTTKYHKSSLKERILNTAFELTELYGNKKVSIRMITKRLNVSSAAIYRHYKSRNDLFEQVLNLANSAFSVYILDNIHDEFSPIERIETSSWNFIQFSIEHSNLYDLIFRGDVVSVSGMSEIIPKIERCGLKDYVCAMRCLIEENKLNISVEKLFLLYWSFILGYSKLVRFNNFVPDRELIKNAITGLAFSYK